VYFMNYTYYDGTGFEKVVETKPRTAPIYLDECTFEDWNVPKDSENCVCEKRFLGLCIRWHCYVHWRNRLTAEYIASWFEDWSLYKYEVYVYLANLTGLKCKNFTAYTMEGVNWQKAPYQGVSRSGDYVVIFTCKLDSPPYRWTWMNIFNVTDITGTVQIPPPFVANFTHAPPRGYAG